MLYLSGQVLGDSCAIVGRSFKSFVVGHLVMPREEISSRERCPTWTCKGLLLCILTGTSGSDKFLYVWDVIVESYVFARDVLDAPSS
jgi:hypothetical protein